MIPWFLLPLVGLFIFGVWFLWYIGRGNKPLTAEKARDASIGVIRDSINTGIRNAINSGKFSVRFYFLESDFDVYEDIIEDLNYEYDVIHGESPQHHTQIEVKW